MARGKKKTKLADLPAQSDPSTELDSATFLRAAQPVLKELEGDLTARAKASPTVTAALKARHASETASKRTVDNFAQWQQNFIDQVAAAWLLSCVFVRTLEDRGLLGHSRIAGPGAADSQKLFFQMAPSLTERDYLLTVFRELTCFEAAHDLFDAKHNPLWLLAPSAEGAKALLALFRTPSSDTPAFRFGQPDTRFLGDLYQDLNERVRKRYALLQTPRFVESFILDRTLERAIERFGLDDTTVIDPTCGSGHFLLGSFDRLYEHRLRAEPGLDPRKAAHKALDAVFGADINPYAVGIARFRLTLSFLEKAGFRKLADAPQLPLHLVVADSLLHNPHVHQIAFADLEDQSIKEWKGQEFALEDDKAARDVLHRTYAAVVGNPPYITVKDKALRDRYRELYHSAFRSYSLGVPFTERFFQLGRDRGYIGMITANSFMKREFGKKLIEEYLPTINLDIIVNTSGAYIPGHGTPTVLLFGSHEQPQGRDVLAVLANRGEPTTPENPAKGHVWGSIAKHWPDEGFENDYVTVARIARASLSEHPWSLGGGGATELKLLLEERSVRTLAETGAEVGTGAVTREDDVFLLPQGVPERWGIPDSYVKRSIIGENVRDWGVSGAGECIWPYDHQSLVPVEITEVERALWPWRTQLASRVAFGKTQLERGLPWSAFSMYFADRMRTPLTITFAFVATHNHFVLDRGAKVFNRSAPIIKLPENATEDDHLALLAYLNSSTACFWMKQVFHNKGSGTDTGKWQDEPAKIAYEFAVTQMSALPLAPAGSLAIDLELARRATKLAFERSELLVRALRTNDLPASQEELTRLLRELEDRDESLLAQLIAVNEELDWRAYVAFGLADPSLLDQRLVLADIGVPLGARPFEVRSRRGGKSEGIDGQRLQCETPPSWPPAIRELWERRIAAIDASKTLSALEVPEYKRRWLITPKSLGGRVLQFGEQADAALQEWFAGRIEEIVAQSTEVVHRAIVIGSAPSGTVAEHLSSGGEADVAGDLLEAESVPFLSCLRFKPSGIQKHTAWEECWAQQRTEDAGDRFKEIGVPPKFASSDYKRTRYWQLRGKLDVPRERFISYPGCESDEDGEPLYGWAGWNHLQRIQALAALYQERKKQGWRAETEPNADGENDDRLIPMLTGLLELLPWVKQLHNDPSEKFDGLRLGDYFERFINGECRELGLTHDDLKEWRPSDKQSRRRKKRGS